jgi:hypothetical protein
MPGNQEIQSKQVSNSNTNTSLYEVSECTELHKVLYMPMHGKYLVFTCIRQVCTTKRKFIIVANELDHFGEQMI